MEPVSPGSLALASVDPAKPVALDAPLRFELTGAQLAASKEGVTVFNGDTMVPASSIGVQGNTITVSPILHDGRNDIVLLASDTQGRALNLQATLWAGAHTLAVRVLKPDGTLADGAEVVATIMDKQGLVIQQTAAGGQVKFENLPDRTILLSAKSGANLTATLTTIGRAGNAEIRLEGFNAPSAIDNNDFSQGTLGWEPSEASVVQIVPHVEEITPVVPSSAVLPTPPAAADPVRRLSSWQAFKRGQARPGGPDGLRTLALGAAAVGPDLALTTQGEGPSTVTRTFTAPAGASSVKVRYRFITSEVPGGYFGSQYNDSYAIQVRTQAGGAVAADANSMNALGLAAFDASGSTTWRVLTLPVAQAGDTVQVDVTVTNVSDGLYDSQMVVDYVEAETLGVAADLATACVNQTVTFKALGASANSAGWSGGGTPATGAGEIFQTRYATHGDFHATATAGGVSAQRSVHIKESSGAAWVARFPTSTALADLAPAFRTSATNFYDAMRTAGASVSISATYRPPQRAFLMHYAWEIAKNGFNPANVPAHEDFEICWVHRNAEGQVDLPASKAAAQAMVNAYHMAHPAALASQHTLRRAVDWTITWSGDLTIRGADGNDVTISTTPRTGADNTQLHGVGAGYGVRKLATDPPHWSANGN